MSIKYLIKQQIASGVCLNQRGCHKKKLSLTMYKTVSRSHKSVPETDVPAEWESILI